MFRWRVMMKTTEILFEAVKEIWDGYSKHPFILGIQNGTLDKEKFKHYLIQDYLYLIDYARTFAIGAAKAKNPETMQLFSFYVNYLTEDGFSISDGYLGELNVTEDDVDRKNTALDNLSYTSYMLRVAYEDGEAEILAAIMSCTCSYERIAKKIIENNPESVNHPFYGRWIQGYASDVYAERNVVLVDLLNRLTAHYTEAQLEHLKEIFVACSRYEMAFWNIGWNLSK